MGGARVTIQNWAGHSVSDLILAVPRLLAVAINRTRDLESLTRTPLHEMPDYRRWPMLALSGEGQTDAVYYVCPKAVLASDEEPFPVGTQFVMESISVGRLAEVFMMKKYATLCRSGSRVRDREVWMSVCYRLEHAGLMRGQARGASR